MRTLCASAIAIVVIASPVLADETTGTVLAFDRQADIIVMNDKTVWQLNPTTLIPADLAAGDTVKMTFTSFGDDGVKSVDTLEKL